MMDEFYIYSDGVYFECNDCCKLTMISEDVNKFCDIVNKDIIKPCCNCFSRNGHILKVENNKIIKSFRVVQN